MTTVGMNVYYAIDCDMDLLTLAFSSLVTAGIYECEEAVVVAKDLGIVTVALSRSVVFAMEWAT